MPEVPSRWVLQLTPCHPQAFSKPPGIYAPWHSGDLLPVYYHRHQSRRFSIFTAPSPLQMTICRAPTIPGTADVPASAAPSSPLRPMLRLPSTIRPGLGAFVARPRRRSRRSDDHETGQRAYLVASSVCAAAARPAGAVGASRVPSRRIGVQPASMRLFASRGKTGIQRPHRMLGDRGLETKRIQFSAKVPSASVTSNKRRNSRPRESGRKRPLNRCCKMTPRRIYFTRV